MKDWEMGGIFGSLIYAITLFGVAEFLTKHKLYSLAEFLTNCVAFPSSYLFSELGEQGFWVFLPIVFSILLNGFIIGALIGLIVQKIRSR